jgi:hypothetical protein
MHEIGLASKNYNFPLMSCLIVSHTMILVGKSISKRQIANIIYKLCFFIYILLVYLQGDHAICTFDINSPTTCKDPPYLVLYGFIAFSLGYLYDKIINSLSQRLIRFAPKVRSEYQAFIASRNAEFESKNYIGICLQDLTILKCG